MIPRPIKIQYTVPELKDVGPAANMDNVDWWPLSLTPPMSPRGAQVESRCDEPISIVAIIAATVLCGPVLLGIVAASPFLSLAWLCNKIGKAVIK